MDYSVAVRSGWQVLVATSVEAEPLGRELSRLIGERGAYALQRITFGARWPVDGDWLAAAPELGVAPLEQAVYDGIDALILVTAPRVDEPAPPARAMRAHLSALRARGRAGEIPHVRCDFPCAYFATQAGMSLPEYEQLFGCNEGIPRPTRNVLFDEKIAGTIHLALGNGFASLGGRNVSDLHWDLIRDMRRGGRVLADGRLVYEGGRWL